MHFLDTAKKYGLPQDCSIFLMLAYTGNFTNKRQPHHNSSQPSKLPRLLDRFHPVGGLELGIDVDHMGLDRGNRNAKPLPDLLVPQARGRGMQHLELALVSTSPPPESRFQHELTRWMNAFSFASRSCSFS